MAHLALSRHLIAGIAALLLLGWLATPAAGQLTDDGSDDELVDGVDDVVDVSSEDGPSDSEQEAAEEGEPEEVNPEPPPEGEPQPQPEPESQPQASDEQASDGGSATPSGPRHAAGPYLRPGGPAPQGSAYDPPPDDGVFDAAEPEVFDGEQPGSHEAADESEVAVLHDQRASRRLDPAGMPRELLATSTALVVLLGAGHALHATREIET